MAFLARMTFFTIMYVNLLTATTLYADCEGVAQRAYDIITRNHFVTGRDFVSYAGYLGDDFVRTIKALGPDGHWVDSGAGTGEAIRSYRNLEQKRLSNGVFERSSELESLALVAQNQKARVTGITRKAGILNLFRFNRDPKFKLLTGRFLEDIPRKDIGRADVITDVFGVMSYAPNPGYILRRYHELLNDNGVVFLHLGAAIDVIEVKAYGSHYTLREWLQLHSGFKVTSVNRWSIKLEKNADKNPTIPDLKILSSRGDGPPLRVYEQQ